MAKRVASQKPSRRQNKVSNLERKRWLRQVANLRRFLKALDGKIPVEGQVWCDKMRAHYGARLQKLLDNEPKP